MDAPAISHVPGRSIVIPCGSITGTNLLCEFADCPDTNGMNNISQASVIKVFMVMEMQMRAQNGD